MLQVIAWLLYIIKTTLNIKFNAAQFIYLFDNNIRQEVNNLTCQM